MQLHAAFHPRPHCLPITNFGVSSMQRVKIICLFKIASKSMRGLHVLNEKVGSLIPPLPPAREEQMKTAIEKGLEMSDDDIEDLV